jgi:putative endonuclease
MAEHAAVNRGVVGSSPTRGANLFSECPVPFFVYVIQSESTGQIYIGQTHDLELRLAQHNDPAYRNTLHTKRRRGPWLLIFNETFETRIQAVKKEKRLKSGAGREWIKKTLIGRDAAFNPPAADKPAGL